MAKPRSTHSGQGAYVPTEMWGGPGCGGLGLTSHIQEQRATHQAVAAARHRIHLVSVVFLLCFCVVAGRLVYVTQFLPDAENRRLFTIHAAPYDRADIVDRNGIVLATNVPSYTLLAKPRIVWHPAETAERLARILGSADEQRLFRLLTSSRTEVRLKAHVTPRQRAQIMSMGLAGLYFTKSQRRAYPMGRGMSHAVGYVDVDNNGLAGVEQSLDTEIRSAAMLGENVPLSLDTRVQFILRDELVGAIEKYAATAGCGIVMDVRNGQVLGLVSYPDFDPNDRAKDPIGNQFNVATKGVYELGSVFKVFTVAMGLDRGAVGLMDGYDTSQPLRFGRFRINDFHGKNRWLSIPEILIYSSNIGAAKIAREVGLEQHRDFIRDLGMYEPAHIELPEVGQPMVPDRWREVSAATISYGHGIAVSPLQVAAAGAAVVNGGMLFDPTIKAKLADGKAPAQRVLSEQTSEQMRGLLRMVVTHGTGGKADVQGYAVGGKTGTADKSESGRYAARAVISSFLGAFPMHDPKYVVFVMLDDPQGIPETHGHATAGWTAAPLAGRVIERIGPVLGLRPDAVPVFEDEQDRLLEVASLGPADLDRGDKRDVR